MTQFTTSAVWSLCGLAFTLPLGCESHCPHCGEPAMPQLTMAQRNTPPGAKTQVRVK